MNRSGWGGGVELVIVVVEIGFEIVMMNDLGLELLVVKMVQGRWILEVVTLDLVVVVGDGVG
jgi:hypothetical protein